MVVLPANLEGEREAKYVVSHTSANSIVLTVRKRTSAPALRSGKDRNAGLIGTKKELDVSSVIRWKSCTSRSACPRAFLTFGRMCVVIA